MPSRTALSPLRWHNPRSIDCVKSLAIIGSPSILTPWPWTTTRGDLFFFEMDPFRRECLMEGLDEIALTLSSEAAIGAYELKTGI